MYNYSTCSCFGQLMVVILYVPDINSGVAVRPLEDKPHNQYNIIILATWLKDPSAIPTGFFF